MKKIAIILLLLLSVALLFCACGGGQSPEDSAAAPNTEGAADQGSNADRVLNIGLGDELVDLDPHSNIFLPDNRVRSQIYDYLVQMDAEGHVAGSLAESYEVSEDGLTYTFHLNKGVLFSDGDELKASDVKFSVDRAAASATNRSAFVNMKSCDAVDDYTVQILMNNADASFLEKLTATYCCIVSEDVVNKYGDQFGKAAESAIGTGPYICTDYVFGESVDLAVNPNYFKGEANIKKVHYTIIKDSNSAVVALQNGDIDLYMYDVPYSFMETVAKDPNLTMLEYPSYNWYYIMFNCEEGIFSDVRMRQAAAYGIDREKAMLVALEGHGELADSPGGSITVANPGNPDWYQYDPEKAKALVKEAGMEGASVELIYMTIDPFDKISTTMAEDLTNMGLNVTVTSMDSTVWDERCWFGGSGEFQITNMRWFYTTKDMSETMNKNLSSAGSGNLSRYVNPAMDELLTQAGAEFDLSQREALYAEALNIFNQDVPVLPLFYAANSRAFTKDLTVDENVVRYDRLYDYSWK